MKHIVYSGVILLLISLLISCNKEDSEKEPSIPSPTQIVLFDEILFYDGYAAKVEHPVPSDIIRVANSKYVTKVKEDQLSSISDYLTMKVTVKAACDNYDRIGNVFLSFVEKGTSYDKNDIASRIEIARFITPFMDKNKLPDEVSYSFDIGNIAKILKDVNLNNKYDFWFELDISGVPYAANKEIEGCSGRNDTFYGTLKLISTDEVYANEDQILIPIASSIRFDNYQNTDEPGETTKSIELQLDTPVSNAKLYLITSNHGANAGGEEYNRREHLIYLDDILIDSYVPGGKSCEPYREHNTQGNGIYSSNPRTNAQWASFSNWCPGDKIPNRVYDIGNLNAGNHTFKIDVPDAEFVDGQGNIPLSVYIQGSNELSVENSF